MGAQTPLACSQFSPAPQLPLFCHSPLSQTSLTFWAEPAHASLPGSSQGVPTDGAAGVASVWLSPVAPLLPPLLSPEPVVESLPLPRLLSLPSLPASPALPPVPVPGQVRVAEQPENLLPVQATSCWAAAATLSVPATRTNVLETSFIFAPWPYQSSGWELAGDLCTPDREVRSPG